jgi:hypothetical protein
LRTRDAVCPALSATTFEIKADPKPLLYIAGVVKHGLAGRTLPLEGAISLLNSVCHVIAPLLPACRFANSCDFLPVFRMYELQPTGIQCESLEFATVIAIDDLMNLAVRFRDPNDAVCGLIKARYRSSARRSRLS